MKRYLMDCGHVAQGTTKDGKPICVICAPYAGVKVVEELDTENAGLDGRKARCPYCGRITDSKWTLPFFEYRPDKECDEYYCGCGGWD
mgnify:CR=1